MVQLIRSGALQYANANPVEEARLAWELAGDLMARREGGQPEEQPGVQEERTSLAVENDPQKVNERGNARSCNALCNAWTPRMGTMGWDTINPRVVH